MQLAARWYKSKAGRRRRKLLHDWLCVSMHTWTPGVPGHKSVHKTGQMRKHVKERWKTGRGSVSINTNQKIQVFCAVTVTWWSMSSVRWWGGERCLWHRRVFLTTPQIKMLLINSVLFVTFLYQIIWKQLQIIKIFTAPISQNWHLKRR